MIDAVTEFAARRNDILKRIDAAAKAANRSAREITLVGVSKKQPEDRIDAALASGQRIFGENRVQEAEARWLPRRAAYPDLDLRLIGPLKTKNAEQDVSLFDVIETLDLLKLAAALRKAMDRTGRLPAPLCAGQYRRGRPESRDRTRRSGRIS